jgi:hypothetical protein
MVAREISLRAGVASDAVSLTGLYLRSRRTAMPWLPSVYDEAETLGWMRQIVLAGQGVIVAEDGHRFLGFAALDGLWLEHLYVDSDAQAAASDARFSRVPKKPDPTVSVCASSPATLMPDCSPRRLAVSSLSRATVAETRRTNRTALTHTFPQHCPLA